MAPTLLSAVSSTLLPPELTGPIFTKATETSAVMNLARRVPLSVTAQTAVPIPMDVPTAYWVAEGGRKKASSSTVGVKTMQGKKIAVLVPVSEEVVNTNAAGLWTQLADDLPTAISRGFDMAAIHGTTLGGGAGPFDNHLMETSNTVSLGTAAQTEGGIYADLVHGTELVTDADWDFSGFAADPRLKPKLQLATDTMGHPLFVQDLSGQGVAGGGSLIGYPTYYNRGVSGKVRRQSASTDSGLRAIGGDFSQCAYGVGMEISVRISRDATYFDDDGTAHSAFQDNLVLILAEAYYGFVVGEPDAFVAYDAASGSY